MVSTNFTPITSMYGVVTYICLIFTVSVGKYTSVPSGSYKKKRPSRHRFYRLQNPQHEISLPLWLQLLIFWGNPTLRSLFYFPVELFLKGLKTPGTLPPKREAGFLVSWGEVANITHSRGTGHGCFLSLCNHIQGDFQPLIYLDKNPGNMMTRYPHGCFRK